MTAFLSPVHTSVKVNSDKVWWQKSRQRHHRSIKVEFDFVSKLTFCCRQLWRQYGRAIRQSSNKLMMWCSEQLSKICTKFSIWLYWSDFWCMKCKYFMVFIPKFDIFLKKVLLEGMDYVKCIIKQSRALNETASHSYGVSLDIWDHTVLPSTRHKWTPARQAGMWFTYPWGMEGWVNLGDQLRTEMVYPPTDGHPSKY